MNLLGLSSFLLKVVVVGMVSRLGMMSGSSGLPLIEVPESCELSQTLVSSGHSGVNFTKCIDAKVAPEAIAKTQKRLRDGEKGTASTFYGSHYAVEYKALCGVYNLHITANSFTIPNYPVEWRDLEKKVSDKKIEIKETDVNYTIYGDRYEKHTFEVDGPKNSPTNPEPQSSKESRKSKKNQKTETFKLGIDNETAIQEIFGGLTPLQQKAAKKLEVIWNKTKRGDNNLSAEFNTHKRNYEEAMREMLDALKKIANFTNASGQKADQANNANQCLTNDKVKTQAPTIDGKTPVGDEKPPSICKTDASEIITNDKEGGNHYSAGKNILVDMACLCIPSTGLCTACLGSQALPCWGAHEDIKTQIELLDEGCRKLAHGDDISSKRIGEAHGNFLKALGRWDNTQTAYELKNKLDGAGTPNDPNIGFNSGGGNTTCTGAEKNHCVRYAAESGDKKGDGGNYGPNDAQVKQYSELHNRWGEELLGAQQKANEAEQAWQTLKEVETKMHHLVTLAEHVISGMDLEEQYPQKPAPFPPKKAAPHPQDPSDFEDLMEKYCQKRNTTELCRKGPICRWDEKTNKCALAESVSVPVMTPTQRKEYTERVKQCGEYDEVNCTDAKGCKYESGKCTPLAEVPLAHIPLNPSTSHFSTFSLLSFLAFF